MRVLRLYIRSEGGTNNGNVFCWRTQVSRPGLEPTLCWTKTLDLRSGVLICSGMTRPDFHQTRPANQFCFVLNISSFRISRWKQNTNVIVDMGPKMKTIYLLLKILPQQLKMMQWYVTLTVLQSICHFGSQIVVLRNVLSMWLKCTLNGKIL